MTITLAVLSIVIAALALGLATRNYAATWPGQGVHIHTGTFRGVLTNGFEEHEVSIRVMGSGVAYEAQVVTWNPPETIVPESRARMACTSDSFDLTALVKPDRTEQARVGVVWTTMYWGRPMEQGYRTALSEESLFERWHWHPLSYVPGQPTSGEWRTVDETPPDKLTSIPREGDERDRTGQ